MGIDGRQTQEKELRELNAKPISNFRTRPITFSLPPLRLTNSCKELNLDPLESEPIWPKNQPEVLPPTSIKSRSDLDLTLDVPNTLDVRRNSLAGSSCASLNSSNQSRRNSAPVPIRGAVSWSEFQNENLMLPQTLFLF